MHSYFFRLPNLELDCKSKLIELAEKKAEDHPFFPRDIAILPLSQNRNQKRVLGQKSDGTECYPCEYVPDSFRSFMQSLKGYYWYWTLTVLKPGGRLPLHSDTIVGRNTSGITRIHWPLQTNPHSYFLWSESGREVERAHLACDTVYAVDVHAEHSIINEGNTNRIHLLVNYDQAYSTSMVEGVWH